MQGYDGAALCNGNITVQCLASQGLTLRAGLRVQWEGEESDSTGGVLGPETQGRRRGGAGISGEVGHNPGIFGPGVAAVPGKAGANLVFLQQGPVLCGVPGLVPHTWRSQLHPRELRVSADTKHGHGTEWQGDSAKGLRVAGKQSKPTGGDLQVSGVSLGACAGLDGLRKQAEPLGLRVRRGDSCTEAAGGLRGSGWDVLSYTHL